MRDPDYRVRSAAVTEVAGAPAIEVDGEQVLSRRDLRTRSVHVFDGGVGVRDRGDRAAGGLRRSSTSRVMDPLLDSLELEGEVTEDTG